MKNIGLLSMWVALNLFYKISLRNYREMVTTCMYAEKVKEQFDWTYSGLVHFLGEKIWLTNWLLVQDEIRRFMKGKDLYKNTV